MLRADSLTRSDRRRESDYDEHDADDGGDDDDDVLGISEARSTKERLSRAFSITPNRLVNTARDRRVFAQERASIQYLW